MTPAPPNNPGHQEAQGRRSETTTQRPPWKGADDSLNAKPDLNALDALLGATGKQSYVVIDYFRAPRGGTPSVAAMIVSDGKPVFVRGGFSILEALQNLVQ